MIKNLIILIVFLTVLFWVSFSLIHWSWKKINYNIERAKTYSSYVVLFTTLMGFILGRFWKPINDRLDKILGYYKVEFQRAYQGHKGEKKVENWLLNILDNNYWRKSNFVIPGFNFDIDFLIVCPKGLIMFEVKNPTDLPIFMDGKVFSEDKKSQKLKPYPYNPVDEFRKHRKAMTDYLETKGVTNINIKGALIMAGGASISEWPGIHIIYNEQVLKEYFFNYLENDDQFTPEFCKKLAEILNK